MAGDLSHFFNIESRFEQAAGSFAAQIMVAQIFNTQGVPDSLKTRRYGTGIVGEN
ncbi:hypothetical protein ACZ87_02376 [Candidatus Erwinia dacicola]|uniref:Uncharacterized protein n=1 Tax=Candidatus Erwinia dacicola TaxID=252393 RepID=A0A328TJZ4_9GAMM|nr:hypothetical protein ACZ87_02376 [Candidatus Erwinia dacicola]